MMFQSLYRRHVLTRRVLPGLVLLLLVKALLMIVGFQPFELNTLVSSMMAANVFLLGFLISGAMPDFKEAERLPGEMAVSLDSIVDECLILYKQKQAPEALEGLRRVMAIADAITDWFARRSTSVALMDRVRDLNDVFGSFESLTQANFIVRLKQEQAALRKLITRAHTIRETTFAQTAYVVAEVFTFMTLCTFLLVVFDSSLNAMWFMGAVVFLLLYMLLLIHDLDNPFSYRKTAGDIDEVSLRPLEVVHEKLEAILS